MNGCNSCIHTTKTEPIVQFVWDTIEEIKQKLQDQQQQKSTIQRKRKFKDIDNT